MLDEGMVAGGTPRRLIACLFGYDVWEEDSREDTCCCLLPAERVRRCWPMRSPLAEPLLVQNIVILNLTLEQFWYERNEMSAAAIAVTTTVITRANSTGATRARA